MSSTPIIIAILEKRRLDNWRNAFLKTTKLVSGQTGSKPGGDVPMAGASSYPAVDPCSPGETIQSLVLWTVACLCAGHVVFVDSHGRSPLEVSSSSCLRLLEGW